LNAFDQIGFAEIARRNVDRQVERGTGPLPPGKLVEGGVQDPLGRLTRQRRSLDDGNELGGRDVAEGRMTPAQQRFDTDAVSIGVQKGPPIGVQKGPRLSSGVTGMAGVPFALVAA
jgi:hypothetical protein